MHQYSSTHGYNKNYRNLYKTMLYTYYNVQPAGTGLKQFQTGLKPDGFYHELFLLRYAYVLVTKYAIKWILL